MRRRAYTFDLSPNHPSYPKPGDRMILHPHRGDETRWTVVEARPVESRVWPNRWKLTLLSHPDPPADGVYVWHSVPYRRGEEPRMGDSRGERVLPSSTVRPGGVR